MAGKISIEYTIPTSSEYWTRENDDIPSMFFDRIEDEITEFAAREWPDTEVDFRRVIETTSLSNRSRVLSGDEDAGEAIIEWLDHWMSDRWPSWLAEAYEAYA